ncbi:MAG: nitrilase-related carbon-nitrogen hydrolase [Thermodesulfovibrionales bacterium]
MKTGFFQFDPVFGDINANVRKVIDAISGETFDIIVLPELFNSGYQFTSHDEVRSLSEDIPDGFTTNAMAELSKSMESYIVFGLTEHSSGKYFNSAVITGPEGFIGTYRKIHLFYEENLWFTPGDTGFKVWDTAIGKIGIMVCFDWFFPESARILSLMGAEVIAHPSNLVLPYCPDGMPTRCLENSVFAVTANRTGSEDRYADKKPLDFIGSSQITGTKGEIIFRAPEHGDSLFIAELNLEKARTKDFNPYNNIFKDRKPQFYSLLTGDNEQDS